MAPKRAIFEVLSEKEAKLLHKALLANVKVVDNVNEVSFVASSRPEQVPEVGPASSLRLIGLNYNSARHPEPYRDVPVAFRYNEDVHLE